MSVQRSITVQLDDESAIRTETLFGKEYTVFPVVAMVEGVRFGAAQTEPELGLAEEFGSTPILWANRPLVLGHPKIGGQFVSANTPSVLESWCFGMTMNPDVVEGKLKVEAWIDVARVTELGGDFQTTLDRINSGETVEVSVGFYSDLEKTSGKFNNQSYGAVWRNIRPDHLAILPQGQVGACSVADGCGVPRLNELGGDMADKPKEPCSCGGHSDLTVEEEKPFELVEAENRTLTRALNAQTLQAADSPIKIHKISDDAYSADVEKLLRHTLRKKYGSYTYMYGYTGEYVVFEDYHYNDGNGSGYRMMKQSFNLNGDIVSFVGEPTEVILLTRIVETPASPVLSVNSDPNVSKENDMADELKNTPAVQTEDKTKAPEATTTTPAPAPAPAVQTADPVLAPPATPKVLSVQEFLAQAPVEIREVYEQGIATLSAKRNEYVETIMKSPGNRFPKDYLAAQSMTVLEGMAALAATANTASYLGASAPVQLDTVQATNVAAPPPALFPVKAA